MIIQWNYRFNSHFIVGKSWNMILNIPTLPIAYHIIIETMGARDVRLRTELHQETDPGIESIKDIRIRNIPPTSLL